MLKYTAFLWFVFISRGCKRIKEISQWQSDEFAIGQKIKLLKTLEATIQMHENAYFFIKVPVLLKSYRTSLAMTSWGLTAKISEFAL